MSEDDSFEKTCQEMGGTMEELSKPKGMKICIVGSSAFTEDGEILPVGR
jgi:hypothetical protein